MTVFEIIFNYLEIDLYAKSTVIVLTVAGVSLGVSLIIRILTCSVYYTNISALILFAKPIEKKADVKKTPSSLINRCVAEYMACGEYGAPLLMVDQIVMKHMLKMNFLFINLKTLEKLSLALEVAVLGVAVSAAAVTGGFGWLAVIGSLYLAYRIVLLFFDAQTLRDKLFYGMTTYINRELGKFYIPDDKAGLRVFKNELHSSLMEQASILQNAINNLNQEVSGVVREAYGAMQKTLDAEIKKYDNLGDKLKMPIESMGACFVKFEAVAGSLSESSKQLSDNIGLMDKKLSVITGSLDKNTEANTRIIGNSETLFRELKDSLKSFDAAYSSIEAELELVGKTQQALDVSLQKYEVSLQETAGKVGDAVGSIIEYRGRAATDSLNESLMQHVKQFQSDTAKLIEKMTALFEQSYEQNRSEIQTLLRIEDLVKK